MLGSAGLSQGAGPISTRKSIKYEVSLEHGALSRALAPHRRGPATLECLYFPPRPHFLVLDLLGDIMHLDMSLKSQT